MPLVLITIAAVTVVAFLVAVAIFRKTVREDPYNYDSPYVERVYWGAAGATAGLTFIASFFLSAFAGLAVPGTYTDCYDTPLVALGSNQATGGSFFLGSGTLHSEPVYEYLWDDGTGRIYQSSVSAVGRDGPVFVVEDQEGDHGKVTICPGKNVGWTRWVALLSRHDGYAQYEFHVPPGSVRRGFDVGVG